MITIVVHEFVQRCANTNHLVDLGDVSNINLTFDIVNKITPKWCLSSRCPSIPNQNQSLGIKTVWS
jgi:hypothetical protein